MFRFQNIALCDIYLRCRYGIQPDRRDFAQLLLVFTFEELMSLCSAMISLTK